MQRALCLFFLLFSSFLTIPARARVSFEPVRSHEIYHLQAINGSFVTYCPIRKSFILVNSKTSKSAWLVTKDSRGNVALQLRLQGVKKYLSAGKDGNLRLRVRRGAAESFTLERSEDGRYFLRSMYKTYLHVNSRGKVGFIFTRTPSWGEALHWVRTKLQVAAGRWHTCAIKPDQTLACWGDKIRGKATVPADLGEVKAVAADHFNTCAIKADNTLACWGSDYYKRDNFLLRLGAVRAVGVSIFDTCALKYDKTLACWDFHGRSIDIPAGLRGVKSISVGNANKCAIKADNTLDCWTKGVPSELGTVKAVAASFYHTCAIKSDNTLACWGDNTYGQSKVPPDLGTVRAVASSYFHTCAIKADHHLACWGDNAQGQSNIPPDLGTVKAVTAGGHHTCALRTDQSLVCWGYNESGQSTVPDFE